MARKGKFAAGIGEPPLSQAELHRLLTYSEATGIFTWQVRGDVRKTWNTRYAGQTAGCAWKAPRSYITYWVIRIFDYPFLAHRLAWLYVTGSWPNEYLDHRDLDGTNNKWSNLRSASPVQNSANRGRTSRNTTGFKGVSLCKKTGRFRATIQMNGKWRYIGQFSTAEEAHAAYCRAAKQLAGEFARTA